MKPCGHLGRGIPGRAACVKALRYEHASIFKEQKATSVAGAERGGRRAVGLQLQKEPGETGVLPATVRTLASPRVR